MSRQKICSICGKPFYSDKNARRICYDTHYRKCVICGNQFIITSSTSTTSTCSRKCTRLLREQTMEERYGVKHALEKKEFLDKAQATTESRFGVKHAAQNEQIKSKMREQFQTKYGVDTPFQMKDFQEKSQHTCLERYGVKYTSQIPGRTEKMQKTNLERYGSTCPLGNEKIKERFRQDMLEKFGVPYYVMTKDCRKLQRHVISSLNRSFQQRLTELNIQSSLEFHVESYSYDIYLPEYRLLVEIDPTYTHNTVGNHFTSAGLSPNYHKDKSSLASKNGYHCIHIFDWDNIDKILDMLKPRQHVYARKCEIQELSAIMLNTFLTKYHLQGTCKGQTFAYGLFYKDKLLQVMTFGKARYANKYEYELLRLCTLPGYQVVGGASKLFKHFLKEQNPASIISYCDLSKFSGDVYTSLGMKLDHTSSPACIWSKNSEYIRHSLLLQRGYDQLFGTHYGKGTSNEELMIENGWLPVYDCGQSVYTWTR